MTIPQPSVGRIVHYVPDVDALLPAACRAAIVTAVNDDDSIALTVFDVCSSTMFPSVDNSEPLHQRGTWHWPERV